MQNNDEVTDQTTWPNKCSQCGQLADTRPYGVGGALVCFPCGTSTPEAEAVARATFNALLEAGDPCVLTDLGPQRMPENLTEPGSN